MRRWTSLNRDAPLLLQVNMIDKTFAIESNPEEEFTSRMKKRDIEKVHTLV